jgi:pterin-4a-carbinolamine dehydratase
MSDPTEPLRRRMIETGQPARDLEQADQRWSTEDLKRDFTVKSFMAPFVFVTRKADGADGTMEFTHSPRWYFNFKADKR